jgi:spermidine/putrescine transport system substrate-binding protein
MRALAVLLMTAAPALAEGDLFIYTWGEYTPPDLVAKFEAEFGVKVHIDSYDSMETMIAKLRAGGAGYDIIVPGDATMQVLIAEDMVEKIDVFAMPNFTHVDDKWREVYWDPKREYSAPWAWGSTAFAVDTARGDRGLFLAFRAVRPGG